jgi:hypothetical protein
MRIINALHITGIVNKTTLSAEEVLTLDSEQVGTTEQVLTSPPLPSGPFWSVIRSIVR